MQRLPGQPSERWTISEHATDRYVERIDRGVTRERAREELVEQCLGAHFVKLLPGGLELWRGPKPRRIRLRAERRENGEMVLATVLEAFDGLRRCR